MFVSFSLSFEIDASQVENPWGDREVAKGCRGAESLHFFKTVATSRARTGFFLASRAPHHPAARQRPPLPAQAGGGMPPAKEKVENP